MAEIKRFEDIEGWKKAREFGVGHLCGQFERQLREGFRTEGPNSKNCCISHVEHS
jgi:hypothetical protein